MANLINRTTNPDNPTFRIRISLGKNLLTGKYDYYSKTFKGTRESAKDYANYREIVGLIRGLRSSITHIQDLSRKQLEGDDD